MAQQNPHVIPPSIVCMSSPENPTKACHNCRRKRLRCDRTYPHCKKCLVAGRECLGYGNLLRWTGAVASRGKLAGQAAPLPLQKGAKPVVEFKFTGSASALSSALTGAESPEVVEDIPESEIVRRLSSENAISGHVASPWVLADPLFQDLNPSYRYYLSYLSYDLPERNPFRSLLPMTKANPLLQHVIVAASAVHLSNLMSPKIPPSVMQGRRLLPTNLDASQKALEHALVAKQKALRLMNFALKDIKSVPADVILAAALFFVNVELMESGKHGWKAHLEGAGQIMAVLQLTDVPSNDLLDHLLSDCFVYFILASAFQPHTSDTAVTSSYLQSSNIPLVLQKAAANSYQCCPPEILDILYSASRLSNTCTNGESSSEKAKADAAALLQKALEFDIAAWAYDVRNIPYLQNVPVQSRIHTSTAHRLAACLYILQVVPSLEAVVGANYADVLSQELYEQLASVPDDDPNFKATSWPTFIAGARETDPLKRTLIMDRLQRLMVQYPWGFMYTAMDTLRVLWGLDGEGKGSKSWVQTLKDPDLNFLMV
ncbi:Acriflavine sensitivity control protein acr-2 [Paramyrothecium foliicola]|nr:Acriflavine sensitivity control protein acr-2 [Paramyrothecium foliicola]